jgi:hypothetical protein
MKWKPKRAMNNQPMNALEAGISRLQPWRGQLSLSEDHVIVNVQRRLNAEQFKAVVAVVIGRLGGEYASLGGTGYFRIPKRRA